MKGIQICSNEGAWDNHEIVKIDLRNLKSSSPEPLGQFQPNLASLVEGGFSGEQCASWASCYLKPIDPTSQYFVIQ